MRKYTPLLTPFKWWLRKKKKLHNKESVKTTHTHAPKSLAKTAPPATRYQTAADDRRHPAAEPLAHARPAAHAHPPLHHAPLDPQINAIEDFFFLVISNKSAVRSYDINM